MQPTLFEGDLALVRNQDAYEAGDIVAFRVPEGDLGEGAVIIHRIIAGGAETGYVLQGDNRDSADRWHPHAGDVVGATWFHVDDAGAWFAWLFEPMGRTLLVGVVATFLLIGNGPAGEDRPQRRSPSRPGPARLLIATADTSTSRGKAAR